MILFSEAASFDRDMRLGFCVTLYSDPKRRVDRILLNTLHYRNDQKTQR